MKLNNKSSNVVQVNNSMLTSVNTGSYVNIGVPSHSQYNNDVALVKSQYLFDTENNVYIIHPSSENVDFTRFKTIGNEAVISGCITMHDIIDFYASGCIQQFYECFCSSHSDSESITLGRFLSAIGVEVWKSVTCYGGIYKDLYMVSNLGRVLSLNKNKQAKILKQHDNGHGYLFVRLSSNGKVQNIRVHRLVALTFYGEPTEQLEACHSNTNKLDNRLFNLEFKTHYENLKNPITLMKYRNTIYDRRTAKAKAVAPTVWNHS